MPSISNGLFAGRAGIQSHGSAIGVLADNIANANTIAFKQSRPEFSDLLAGNIGGGTSALTVGSGSSLTGVTEIFNQGTFEFTGRSLDVAVDGNGFLILDDNGSRFYSRAGNMKINEDGDLLNQQGLKVMGFPANGSGGLQTINVNNVTQSDVETENVSFTGNLDASAPNTAVPGGTPTFAQLAAAASYSNFVDIYDSLGAKHTATVFFFKTASNTWTANTYVDGGELTGGTAGDAVQLTGGTVSLTFNSAGQLLTAGTFTTTPPPSWLNGSASTPVDWDFSGFSQFSSASNIASITQDGKGGGNVTSFSITLDGQLFAQLDNGQTSTIGTIALATFSNPEGLSRQGNSLYIKTTSSGEPVVGTPNTGQYGSLQSGAIELSTSDLAADFIKLISLQRGFQSSSRVITAIDELLNEIVNLAR